MPVLPCCANLGAMTPTNIAVEPRSWRRDDLVAAAESAGATVAEPSSATGLIWADPQCPEKLAPILARNPQIDWVQLPYAGIEPYLDLVDDGRAWTCGKGIYAEPVAEMALAMLLAGFRGLVNFGRATSWGRPIGAELRGARLTILGGGGITEQLLPLLAPFGCDITVVRNRAEPLDGAARVLTTDGLNEALGTADGVVLALALTPATSGMIGRAELDTMNNHAWLVNVARGAHVVTDDLVEALEAGSIGGACLDVTDPEPLPDGHPLWTIGNCLLTPHVGNTPEMGIRLLARRVRDNVARYLAGDELLGPVYPELGY